MKVERRYRLGHVEYRGDEDEQKRIVGIASVFYREGDKETQYELWPGVVERIMPGAFDAVLRTNPDVMGLFNHDPNMVLGRTKSKTLRLAVIPEGLMYEIEPSDTSVYRDVMAWLRRGDVDGSSFAFNVKAETWRTADDGTEIREINEVDLLEDVGPVTYPAYTGTPTGVRGANVITEARAKYDAWKTDHRARVRWELEARKRFLRLHKH